MLKIVDPCKQDWNLMSHVEGGKYCTHCAQNVIDFSNMSDQEIIKFLNQSGDNVCGRLRQDQLNRPIIQSAERVDRPILYKILAGILLLSASKVAFGNGRLFSEKNPFSPEHEPHSTTVALEHMRSNPSDTTKAIIRGRIIDSSTGETLVGATVKLKDSDYGASSDIDGIYEISVPDKFLGDTIIIEVSYIRFEKATVSFHRSELPIQKDIFLKVAEPTPGEPELIIVGRITPADTSLIGSVKFRADKAKKKWWQRSGKNDS